MMRKTAAGLFGVGILTATIGWTSVRPSHDRDWIPEQRRMPQVHFEGSTVTIGNVRDFRWGPGAHVRPRWDERTYDIETLETVWYVLTPFSRDRRGPAHAFVSFGFSDGRYLAISVEARREVGEAYSIAGGMMKQYEIMYVVGDERDLIQLRVARGDDVYVYPIRATAAQARALFLGMLTRANELHDRPEFYGTVGNNCTTNLLTHVNSIAREPIPYGRRILLPGYSDAVAHERGLIDTDLTLDAARERYRVSDQGLNRAGQADFSAAIRAWSDD